MIKAISLLLLLGVTHSAHVEAAPAAGLQKIHFLIPAGPVVDGTVRRAG
ncbi:MAG: hypothetical protein O6945_15555 [Gammaproteobacteria bacterium]|nr:hypothetical protein [Gammaproteobacteria bacterium]